MGSRLSSLAAVTLLCLLAMLIIVGCGQTATEPALVTVPDLVGRSVAEAEGSLQQAGLEIGEKQEMHSDAAPAGTIISTTPAGGTELEEGSTLTLIVSLGPEMVTLPSLMGSAEANAVATLQSLGFQVEAKRGYNEDMQAGLVYAMDPVPNSTLRRGARVTLLVSQGSAYITCTTCGGRKTITTRETCAECGGTGTCFT